MANRSPVLRSVPTYSVAEATSVVVDNLPVLRTGPAYQAYRMLQVGFTFLPIIAGADKFRDSLVNWQIYLAPTFPKMLGLTSTQFIRGVGVIEILAGVGVAMKPKLFGYVASAWLLAIVANLLIQRNYYDTALRDVALSIGAFALGNLARTFELQRK